MAVKGADIKASWAVVSVQTGDIPSEAVHAFDTLFLDLTVARTKILARYLG